MRFIPSRDISANGGASRGGADHPAPDYNTLPQFKKKAHQMIAFHWRENDQTYIDALEGMGIRDTGELAKRFPAYP